MATKFGAEAFTVTSVVLLAVSIGPEVVATIRPESE